MNKAESKYFNTAQLMNTALLYLLQKKEFSKITVKEICQKAGVNRSTFYLHYETIDDLLCETIENLSREFKEGFKTQPVINDKQSSILITKEYLMPYLQFVKNNKQLLKLIHSKPELFNAEKVYSDMCTQFFYPALDLFSVNSKEKPYIFEYFTKGVVAIINKWVEKECEDSIEFIIKVINDCVGYKVDFS